jgi:2-haloacid dehalogenase
MSPELDQRLALKRIEALAFDAYGTLFDVFSITALSEEVFPGHGHALAQLWRTKQLQYSLLRSLMDRYQDFWQLTRDGLVYATKQLKLDLTPEAEHTLMDGYLRLDTFPDVKPGLELLRARGLRLAILSNGEPTMLERVMSHAGIGSLFDVVISADDVRVFKPSPRVYRAAVDRLQTDGQALGFVSSNSWDIQGAASVGLNTFWVQRSPTEPPEELGYPTGPVVRSLTDLVEMLKATD